MAASNFRSFYGRAFQCGDIEKTGDSDPNIIEKLGGYEKIYDKLNEFFPDYFATITDFGNLTAELEAYKFGYEYVKDLSAMFERFYRTFGEKVTSLVRRQDDLADSLKFTKGDSVFNVCASREMLQELSRSTRKQGEEGALLDSELNGRIFDAIKANVAFEREIRSADIVEEDRRIDVFDEILLDYFRDTVRRDCKAIDMILHNGRVGEVYNIGGHNEMRNIDIVKIICKALGKPESLITYVTDRKGHDMRYAIDPTKIHRELGWLPETKFADGIQKTIRWYLDNRAWWETIISGEYRDYYEKMYGNR